VQQLMLTAALVIGQRVSGSWRVANISRNGQPQVGSRRNGRGRVGDGCSEGNQTAPELRYARPGRERCGGASA
jgi:hypothetical protein